jgi:peroxiredoxin Q/BCP
MTARAAVSLALALAIPALVTATGCGQTQRPDGGSGMLAEGVMAPSLTATAHDGSAVTVGPEQDGPLIVYFYPKDETPGCTKEACAFRDAWARYESAGVGVVGVSADSNESHREFAQAHDLPFPLVADEDGTWARAFGVSTFGGMTARVSFLVSADGRVAKVYPDVDPGTHASAVLKDAADSP